MFFLRSLFSRTPKLTASEILKKISLFAEVEAVTPHTKAAILLSPDNREFFRDFRNTVIHLMDQIKNPPQFKLESDDHGTKWIILEKAPFRDLVTAIDDISAAIWVQKTGDRMIAAIFKGTFEKEETYWICNYRTARFYPFIPEKKTGSNEDDSMAPASRGRNHEKEMALGQLFRSGGLPVETPENWFALWDAPF